MRQLTSIDKLTNATFATIGFFDGVHLGHRFLLNELKQQAQFFNLESLVVSFNNSPQRVLCPEVPINLLTTSSEKMQIFDKLGLDNCLMLDFDKQLAAKTSSEFLAVLHDRFCVRKLLVGYDHRFGSDQTATNEDYAALGQKIGIEVAFCSPFVLEQYTVSSSKIRELLRQGDVECANQLLGSTYTLTGKVVFGNQIGQTLGFPTANLSLPAQKLVPRNGVYAVRVIVGKNSYKGMLNIGLCPTVPGTHQTIEVHILDFDRNLYGETITLELLKRLRDERQFASLEELRRQLQYDKEVIKNL
ncbi:MAG: bifunctional riboflavin kinase/FAD synthetase [Paludibacteraceae bacterium]|nr:bifunctional riboflavin kinase/FAD synthetase [Paludibacteraceae bacterium]